MSEETTEQQIEREVDLCMEILDLAAKVRQAGHIDSANAIVIEAFAVAQGTKSVVTREHISLAIQALATVAMANGFTCTAINLSSIGLAQILGEAMEVYLGIEMIDASRVVARKFKESDHYWPEEFYDSTFAAKDENQRPD